MASANEFSELDLINKMYEENIDEDRHFDESLINKRRSKMKVFKKGDYVYYVNSPGDTYPTQIYAIGRSGRRTNSVLIELQTFRSNMKYKRWVNVARVRLQDE